MLPTQGLGPLPICLTPVLLLEETQKLQGVSGGPSGSFGLLQAPSGSFRLGAGAEPAVGRACVTPPTGPKFGWGLPPGRAWTHIGLQEVVHAGLGHLLGLLKLLQGLAQLLIGDPALSLLLVVEVQAAALQLLQVVLGWGRGHGAVRCVLGAAGGRRWRGCVRAGTLNGVWEDGRGAAPGSPSGPCHTSSAGGQ